MWLFQRPVVVDRWSPERGVSNAHGPAGYLQAQLSRMPLWLSNSLLLEKIFFQIPRMAKRQESCVLIEPHQFPLEPWRHRSKYHASIEALRRGPNFQRKSLPTAYLAENRQATKTSAGQTLISKGEGEI